MRRTSKRCTAISQPVTSANTHEDVHLLVQIVVDDKIVCHPYAVRLHRVSLRVRSYRQRQVKQATRTSSCAKKFSAAFDQHQQGTNLPIMIVPNCKDIKKWGCSDERQTQVRCSSRTRRQALGTRVLHADVQIAAHLPSHKSMTPLAGRVQPFCRYVQDSVSFRVPWRMLRHEFDLH